MSSQPGDEASLKQETLSTDSKTDSQESKNELGKSAESDKAADGSIKPVEQSSDKKDAESKTSEINESKVNINEIYTRISKYDINTNINNIADEVKTLGDKLNKLIEKITQGSNDEIKSIYTYAHPCITLLQEQIKTFTTLSTDKVNNLSKCVNFDTKNGLSLNSCPIICNDGINLVGQISNF